MPKPTGPQFEPIHLLNEAGHKRVFDALYHGTMTDLSGVEELSPEKSARPNRKLSFATPSLSAAKRFAGDTGFVYQVEPVDREDTNSTWAREMKYFKPRTTEVVSSKGFRIMRQVHPK
jgi:hypothetical protein